MQTQRLLESPSAVSPGRKCGPGGHAPKSMILAVLVAMAASIAVTYAGLYWYGVKGRGEFADIETCSHEIAALQAQVIKLQGALLQQKSGQPASDRATAVAFQDAATAPSSLLAAGSITKAQLTPISDLNINLGRLLGPTAYFEGISWDIYTCGPPLKTAFKDATVTQKQVDAAIVMMEKQLADAMSDILGGGKEVKSTDSWLTQHESQGKSHEEANQLAIEDPKTNKWIEQISIILSRFLAAESHTMLACPDDGKREVGDIGTEKACPKMTSEQIIQRLGYYPRPLLPLHVIAHSVVSHGICMRRPEQKGVFGQWLKARMYNQEWKTFNVATLEEDAVVFLYDVLYEKLQVFKRQYWLGAIAMQHPYDFFSIADIIWSTRPDLIIETGTANGGSALMWASLMDLNGINGTVVTIDVTDPTWEVDKTHWGGVPRINPMKHHLWEKYVKFIKGGSTDAPVVEQVKAMATKAKSVLVMLDSHHANYHVDVETKFYCPMVTVNNYCIVEDTKLSRFSSDGPLPTAKSFAAKFTEDFRVDRDRELVFTQHAMGYLKRIAIKTPPEQFFN